MAFYEPLHERLGEIGLHEMPGIRPETWDSGHPDPDRPYFEEFASLLSATEPGVMGYQNAFAVDQYFAGPDADLPRARAYIESLIKLARSCGKAAAMKYCRSMGRVGWMQAAFPTAAHVVVLRNPWSQWLSGWQHFSRSGNPYFIVMPFVILTRHHAHPWIVSATAALKLNLSQIAAKSLEERYAVCVKAMLTAQPDVAYRAFLAVWTVTALDALRHASMAIDTDQLASSVTYRSSVEAQFATLSGIQVELSGARASEYSGSPLFVTCGVERCHALALALCDAFEYSGAEGSYYAAAATIVRTKLREVPTAARAASQSGTSALPQRFCRQSIG